MYLSHLQQHCRRGNEAEITPRSAALATCRIQRLIYTSLAHSKHLDPIPKTHRRRKRTWSQSEILDLY